MLARDMGMNPTPSLMNAADSTVSPSADDAVARLAAFLASPERPEDTLDACQLAGFLFAVVTAPERIETGDWIPAVFADADPGFASEAESVQVFHDLVAVYNAAAANAQATQPRLPPHCGLAPDVLADCAPDAPAARWSQGFLIGYEWLLSLWEDHLPVELEAEHEDDLYGLTFLAGAEQIRADVAAQAHRSRRDADAMFRREVQAVRAGFDRALARFAERGRRIYEYNLAREAQRTPVRREKVARNAPCPCGSGKKYKKCCGAAAG